MFAASCLFLLTKILMSYELQIHDFGLRNGLDLSDSKTKELLWLLKANGSHT